VGSIGTPCCCEPVSIENVTEDDRGLRPQGTTPVREDPVGVEGQAQRSAQQVLIVVGAQAGLDLMAADRAAGPQVEEAAFAPSASWLLRMLSAPITGACGAALVFRIRTALPDFPGAAPGWQGAMNEPY
jgi:hypothetical protein